MQLLCPKPSPNDLTTSKPILYAVMIIIIITFFWNHGFTTFISRTKTCVLARCIISEGQWQRLRATGAHSGIADEKVARSGKPRRCVVNKSCPYPTRNWIESWAPVTRENFSKGPLLNCSKVVQIYKKILLWKRPPKTNTFLIKSCQKITLQWKIFSHYFHILKWVSNDGQFCYWNICRE